ncbi:hypothetical protein EJB05_45731 [Eragrostis curvula]|uniref:Uncharacterized protein n=1 Tax=Eragrostis curvula TaxID=38414 RepID=A0A5J9TLC3_9POAL|nr:hypothetical protein EJB05_45731 [Eragrostis curvula]
MSLLESLMYYLVANKYNNNFYQKCKIFWLIIMLTSMLDPFDTEVYVTIFPVFI